MRYEEYRLNFDYYKVLKTLISSLSFGSKSILDVGSNGIDLLSDLNIPIKVSLDIKNPVKGENIISLKNDFMVYFPKFKFDIVCAFQVLEHVQDAKSFAQKLLHTGNNIIISVPYKWPYLKDSPHIHDPVCERKLFEWFERSYDLSIVVFDRADNIRRLVACYFYDNIDFINCFIKNKYILTSNVIDEKRQTIYRIRSEREYLSTKKEEYNLMLKYISNSHDIKLKIKSIDADLEKNRKIIYKLAQKLKRGEPT